MCNILSQIQLENKVRRLKEQNNTMEEKVEKLEHANEVAQKYYAKHLQTLRQKYAGERLILAYFNTKSLYSNSHHTAKWITVMKFKINQRRKYYVKILKARRNLRSRN